MKQSAVIAVLTLTFALANVCADDLVDKGKALVETKKCSICHAIDGKGGKIGKPMNGITEGKTDELLKGALLDPKKTIKSDTKMPAYKLTDDEVAAIISYIRSLKKS